MNTPHSPDRDVQLSRVDITPGCRHGLQDPTATVRLRYPADQHRITPQHARTLWDGLIDLGHADGSPFTSEASESGALSPWLLGTTPVQFASTWMAAAVVALVRYGADPVGRGRVVNTTADTAMLALPCLRADLLRAALPLAIRWVQVMTQSPAPPRSLLREKARTLLASYQARGHSPTTLRFAQAAQGLGLPILARQGMLYLGWGQSAEWLDMTFTGRTSNIGARRARQKTSTLQLLREMQIPVPVSHVVSTLEQARQKAADLGWPVVIKPSNQDQGVGVTPGIRDDAGLASAFATAERYSKGAVIVEQHIFGDDHRILVINGRMLTAAHRVPASVTGDGQHTVAELMEQVNADPRRGKSPKNVLITLQRDREADGCLREQGLDWDQIPRDGQWVRLKQTANISTGGTARSVTQQIHPDNVAICELAAQLLGLDIAGVDLLCPDISRSWREVGGAICEVNSQPGLRPHWLSEPDHDIQHEILARYLFAGRNGRVPVSVLLSHERPWKELGQWLQAWQPAHALARNHGTHAWLGKRLLTDHAESSWHAARVALQHPQTTHAVLDVGQHEIESRGLPVDRCDVLVIQPPAAGQGDLPPLPTWLLSHTRTCVWDVNDPRSERLAQVFNDPGSVIWVAPHLQHPRLMRLMRQGGRAVTVAAHQGVDWMVVIQDQRVRRLWPCSPDETQRVNGSWAVATLWAGGMALPQLARLAPASAHP